MTTVDIEVAYVNPPKPGAKTGSVKTTQGDYFSVWPEKLSQFSQGMRCTVEYESRFSEDGSKEWKTIKKIVGATGGASPARRVAGNAAAAAAQAPTKSTSEEIFVMGVINHALHGSGTVPDALTLTSWIKAARRAWRDGFQPLSDAAKTAPEFDDEVPF